MYTRLQWRKREGSRPLVRPCPRLEDDIKMNLGEIGCGTWTGLISLRLGLVVDPCETENKSKRHFFWGGGGLAE